LIIAAWSSAALSGREDQMVPELSFVVLMLAAAAAPDTQRSSNPFAGMLEAAKRQDEVDAKNPYRDLKDPCILVSRADAEALLGPLATNPYRAGDDGKADPAGPNCFYRGVSGRGVSIHPEYSGGKTAMKMMAFGGPLTGQVLRDQSRKADALQGNWDEQRWNPPSRLSVIKGDTLIEVDVAGANIGVEGAGKLATVAVNRLAHPLAYDGAAAARKAPGPLIAPRDPCSLVPAAEAETILGRLGGTPSSSKERCTYPLVKQGPLDAGTLVLQIAWSGGFAALDSTKWSFGEVVSRTPGQDSQGRVERVGNLRREKVSKSEMQRASEEMKNDPGYQNMLKQMESALGGGLSTIMKDPGATQRLDAITGPWDEGYLVGGTSVVAVKKDVMVSVDARGLDVDKARALVTRAMSKLLR